MSLVSATLATQLAGISGTTEAAAITAWTNAWQAYFIGAQCPSPNFPFTAYFATSSIVRGLCRNAMAAQMVGLSSPGLGASKIQAGIIGWWDYMVANPSSTWPTSTAIAKPAGLTTIEADLAPILAANQADELSAADACAAIAASFHGNQTGGTATIGGTPRTIT